ncbi:MAG: hypothetical protein ACXAAI_15750, partial [Promethearchaeota archaeon]
MDNSSDIGKTTYTASDLFKELERATLITLKSYSNVHRGSGHNSMITTALYEWAREIILEYMELDNDKYILTFCSPYRLKLFKAQLKSTDYRFISSNEFELPLGVIAIAIKRKTLQKSSVIYTGGGMI